MKLQRRLILKLKPTQFAVGMKEIEDKLSVLKKQRHKELKKKIKKHPALVVRSPQGYLYIVDHHHTALALWLLGHKKMYVKIIKDYSSIKMSVPAFWKTMERQKLTHLYDQFGEGPRNPVYLPEDVRGLADDPYRSLAWEARKWGGYAHTGDRYVDFLWAQFFRAHKVLHFKEKQDLKAAKKKVLELCHSRRSHLLPGWRQKE